MELLAIQLPESCQEAGSLAVVYGPDCSPGCGPAMRLEIHPEINMWFSSTQMFLTHTDRFGLIGSRLETGYLAGLFIVFPEVKNN